MRTGVFFFFLALFAVTTAGHIYTIDGYLNYSVTKSMASRAAIEIPKFMMTVEGLGGRHYSKLGVGQSLVSLPFYGMGSLVERIAPGNPLFRVYSGNFEFPHGDDLISAKPQTLIKTSDEDGARVFFTALTNAVVAAGLCVLFWMLLRSFGISSGLAFGGTLLLGFATPLWVYSRDLFAEPVFACCLVATFYLLREPGAVGEHRNLVFAGLASSLGILARMSFAPIVVIFAVYLIFRSGNLRAGSRRALTYGLYCLPGIMIVAILNLTRFGGLTLTGYHTAFDKGFSAPLGRGLFWNLASSYRGILLYAPPVLLFVAGFASFGRKYRAELVLIASIAIYVFVVYSKWWAWHGGWCWGPRFLLPIIPLLILPGIVVMSERPRWGIPLGILLGAVGFVVQLGAILINYTAAYSYWIKIGRLDWAEVDIHKFSPVTTHLKAVLATSPSDYDLWIVQACHTSGSRCVLILLPFVAMLVLATVRIVKHMKTAEA
ncbi:MAG: hypothetical protein ABIJ00_08605 [Candidatus Eisenbacteria bacterium]